MVKQNCTNTHDISQDKDYRYFLYNKNKVSNEDLQSINEYLGKFNDNTKNALRDVIICNIDIVQRRPLVLSVKILFLYN